MNRYIVLSGVFLLGAAMAAAGQQRKTSAISPLPPLKIPKIKKLPISERQFHNIQNMRAGSVTAGSRIEDTQALGGFGTSDNFPLPIGKMPMKKGECYLEIRPNEVTDFDGKYVGMRLLLINATDRNMEFDACDSQLSLIQEARDARGRWRPIEYLPSASCGNSYHRVILGPNEYWTFARPRYTGTFKTRLRFRLEAGERRGSVKKTLLSSEFEGRVNPGQFLPLGRIPSPLSKLVD